ncbi:putative membrane protein [Vibrio sp. HENC-03]|nr:putative membrane protein [Vibrio sp. HENC-03]
MYIDQDCDLLFVAIRIHLLNTLYLFVAYPMPLWLKAQ